MVPQYKETQYILLALLSILLKYFQNSEEEKREKCDAVSVSGSFETFHQFYQTLHP